VPRVADPFSALARAAFELSDPLGLVEGERCGRLDVDLGRLRREIGVVRPLGQRGLVLLDVAQRADRLVVAAIGLEPQRIRDRLLVLAERHDATAGHRCVEVVVVVGEGARVVELRRPDADLDVEVTCGVVGICNERAALGLHVDEALLDELIREVVRGLGSLLEHPDLAIVLALEHVEDRRPLARGVAVGRRARGRLDLRRHLRQVDLGLVARQGRYGFLHRGFAATRGAGRKPGDQAEQHSPLHMPEA